MSPSKSQTLLKTSNPLWFAKKTQIKSKKKRRCQETKKTYLAPKFQSKTKWSILLSKLFNAFIE